jgi:hypothetical protein
MNFWDDLVKTSLVGSEKQELPLHALPEAIREALQQAQGQDKEELFYKAAALGHLYLLGGQRAGKLLIPEPGAAPAESKPYTSAARLQALKALLAEANPSRALLEECLRTIQAQGQIVAPEHLTKLFQIGSNPYYAALLPLLWEVVGERGRWLYAHYEPWHKSPLNDDFWQQQWEEGSNTERQAAFRYFCKARPPQARQVLQAAWPEERSDMRKSLLSIFASFAEAADLPMLEAFWDDLQQTKQRKNIYYELKAELCQILLCRPESKLSQLLIEKIQPYLDFQKGSLRFNIPSAEDDFFCEEVQVELFGFSKEPSQDGESSLALWFRQVLLFIPPSFWTSRLGLDVAATVEALAKAEKKLTLKGKKYNYVVPAVCQAACHFPSPEWTQWLLGHNEYQNEYLPALAAHAAATEVEKILMRGRGKMRLEQFLAAAAVLPAWSEGLSSSFVMQYLQHSAQYYYSKDILDLEQWEIVAAGIDTHVAKSLSTYLDRVKDTQNSYKAERQEAALASLSKLISLKQNIQSA